MGITGGPAGRWHLAATGTPRPEPPKSRTFCVLRRQKRGRSGGFRGADAPADCSLSPETTTRSLHDSGFRCVCESRSRSRSMHLHGYSSAFPRIRTNHHYVAQPDDFGPRRAHGAFGLFCLTRIYLSTCLPAYPLHYPLYCVSLLLPSVVVSHIGRPSRPELCALPAHAHHGPIASATSAAS